MLKKIRMNKDMAWLARPISLVMAISLAGITLMSCASVQYTVQEPYYETENITGHISELHSQTVPHSTTIFHEEQLQPYIVWSNPQLRFNGHDYIRYYGYDLFPFSHLAQKSIKIDFFKQRYYEDVSVSLMDMRYRGQLTTPPIVSASDNLSHIASEKHLITVRGDMETYEKWLSVANAKLDFARFLGGTEDLFLNIGQPAPIEINLRDARDIALIISGPTDPQNCRFNVSLKWEEVTTENVTIESTKAVITQSEQRVIKLKPVIKTRQVPFWETWFSQPR